MSSQKLLPTVTLKPTSSFIYDKRKDKWELLEEGSPVEGEPELELAPFLLEGEGYVTGPTMRTRALEMGGRTGQRHAECLLQQAETIPPEWRQFYLVFPDTLWRSPGGDLCVPCLGFGGFKWVLYFGGVLEDDGWRGFGRVVRLRK